MSRNILLAYVAALLVGPAVTLRAQRALLSIRAPPDTPGQCRFLFVKAKGYYHQLFSPTGEDQTAMLEKILTEPQLGGKLLMTKWKNEKQAYHRQPTECDQIGFRFGLQSIGGENLPVQVLMSIGGNRDLRGSPQDRYPDKVGP
jgi:hypothetical protein